MTDELKIIYEENIPESKSMSRKYDTPWINEESKFQSILFNCALIFS
jgi:hypothetical protein